MGKKTVNKSDLVWKAILPDIKAKMADIAKEMGKLLGKKGMADLKYYQETITDEYEWIGEEEGTGNKPRYRFHIKLLEAVVSQGSGYSGYDIEISGDDEVHEKNAFVWAPLGKIQWTKQVPELKRRIYSLDAAKYAKWMVEALEGNGENHAMILGSETNYNKRWIVAEILTDESGVPKSKRQLAGTFSKKDVAENTLAEFYGKNKNAKVVQWAQFKRLHVPELGKKLFGKETAKNQAKPQPDVPGALKDLAKVKETYPAPGGWKWTQAFILQRIKDGALVTTGDWTKTSVEIRLVRSVEIGLVGRPALKFGRLKFVPRMWHVNGIALQAEMVRLANNFDVVIANPDISWIDLPNRSAAMEVPAPRSQALAEKKYKVGGKEKKFVRVKVASSHEEAVEMVKSWKAKTRKVGEDWANKVKFKYKDHPSGKTIVYAAGKKVDQISLVKPKGNKAEEGEESFRDEPQDNDIIIDGTEPRIIGQRRPLGEFKDEDEMWEAIFVSMNERQYWGNVWRNYERGDPDLVTEIPKLQFLKLTKLSTPAQAMAALKASGAEDLTDDNAKWKVGTYYLETDKIQAPPFDFRAEKGDKNAPKFGKADVLVVIDGQDEKETVEGWMYKDALYLLPGKWQDLVEGNKCMKKGGKKKGGKK